MDCQGCSHYEDLQRILAGNFVWMSTSPHPCTTCRRFPRKAERPDNYQKVVAAYCSGGLVMNYRPKYMGG